ncbi:hypothetical protein [Streptomyces noursei]|uniref:Uncharacterized protein n=2 Tax=Streptomyces noursei TaxID=1971 RepID=A0A401QRH8_STRNR|nr:hypothetical protein [Streptomyces noursei]UWS77564.1 hypothetical protein N1H47_40870 [Streptomyces noursei]UWS77602.1 hypothetical protein N1H47_40665 [Streptomyces noursei]GCB88010.1 hypothetical protein SALB_00679 [Streptomyces noursei]
MSALPSHEAQPVNPHRLTPGQGPQTVRELRAALAAVAPADLVAFNEALDNSPLGAVDDVITEWRHVWALRTRPEVEEAIAAELADSVPLVPAADVFARFGLTDESAA